MLTFAVATGTLRFTEGLIDKHVSVYRTCIVEHELEVVAPKPRRLNGPIIVALSIAAHLGLLADAFLTHTTETKHPINAAHVVETMQRHASVPIDNRARDEAAQFCMCSIGCRCMGSDPGNSDPNAPWIH
jgi:hypothetical protein